MFSKVGIPKKKLPKVIKSLPKLGLFARVVVEKLTQEEIDKWTRKAPEVESSISETLQCESSSEEENLILRKRRCVTYLDSSELSSPNVTTSDSSEGGCGFSAKKTRHFGKRRKRKGKKNGSSDNESWQRVQPVRSAKRNPVIIYSDDSEEDDSVNLIPVNFNRRRQSSLKAIESTPDFSDSSNRKDESSANISATVLATLSPETTTESEPTTSNANANYSFQNTSEEFRNTCADSRSVVASASKEIRISKSSSESIPKKFRIINTKSKTTAARTSKGNRNINLVSKKSIDNTLIETRTANQTAFSSKNLAADTSFSNNSNQNNADKNVKLDPISRLVNPTVLRRHELNSSVYSENLTGNPNSPRYFHTSRESCRTSIDVVDSNELPSWSEDIYNLPATVSGNKPGRIVCADDNIDSFGKFTVVNNDQTNVGKIRLRSLQSLGASENFIKEANLKQGSHLEKMVQNLYSNHVFSVTNSLLNEIAENLREKLNSTEEFNHILKEIQYQNKLIPKEIVNKQLEDIVKKRQEYDANICKLFTEVVESFSMKLGQQKEPENLPILMYLGFLYILNHFIKITNNCYKQSSLFKNVVLVFTESLRNGHFKYDNIIHFFLSNSFHAHCFKLIEHIGSIQSQKNLSLLKTDKADSNGKELRAVPVRKISYKMVDSRMVIEYSKTLEEVETYEAACSDSIKNSNTDTGPSPNPVQSKSITGNPSASSSQLKSVIVSSKNDKYSGNQDKNVAVINRNAQNLFVTNAHANTTELITQSKEASHNTSNMPDNTPNLVDDITISDLLISHSSSFNDFNLSPSPQNKQTSVIHAPQQVNVSHLAMPKAPLVKPFNIALLPSSQDSASNLVNSTFSNPVTTDVSNSPYSNQLRSTLGNGKTSKIQIVRPILKGKQSTRPSPKPLNQLNNVIPRPLLSTEVSSFNENLSDRSSRHEISLMNDSPILSSIPVKTPMTPQGVQNTPVVNPPAYSEAVLNIVKNSYQTTATSSSLRQILLSNVSKKNSNAVLDQQSSNQSKNSYAAPSVVTQENSAVFSNFQPSNMYQQTLRNECQYIASNPSLVGSQVSNNDLYGFPVDDMVSPLNPRSNNQEIQPLYQPQQNQTMVSCSSVLYNDNSKTTFNSDVGTNSSIVYGNNQLNNQPLYYNNNITSSPMLLCDMSPNAGNGENNAVYFNYTQPVPVNPTYSQIPENPLAPSAQLNQMQTPSAPLNQVLPQSLNQFQPTTTDANQYYTTPTTTIHWV